MKIVSRLEKDVWFLTIFVAELEELESIPASSL